LEAFRAGDGNTGGCVLINAAEPLLILAQPLALPFIKKNRKSATLVPKEPMQ
jgi:hypothetical protein